MNKFAVAKVGDTSIDEKTPAAYSRLSFRVAQTADTSRLEELRLRRFEPAIPPSFVPAIRFPVAKDSVTSIQENTGADCSQDRYGRGEANRYFNANENSLYAFVPAYFLEAR